MDEYKTRYYKLLSRIRDIKKELQAVEQEANDVFISEGVRIDLHTSDDFTDQYSSQKRRYQKYI